MDWANAPTERMLNRKMGPNRAKTLIQFRFTGAQSASEREAGQTTFRAFYKREGAIEQGGPQYAPDLTVSYLVPVPEPSSLGLTGLGALTIIAFAAPLP